MKRILLLLAIALLTHLPQTINAQEYYFKLSEKDKKIVNTVITRTVSIDKVVDGIIYAYANEKELNKIKNLGYSPDLLPHPSSLIKGRGMATTIEQMANWNLYPTYEVYRAMMKKFEEDYPNICKLDSIGTTVEGRKIYVAKISDNVLDDEAEPEFFYTSTMHGDETTGYILMLRLIDYLLSNYETDSRIADMVNNVAIYINPNANPDGTYNYGNNTVDGATRANANGVDINRNFPYVISGGPTPQPETVIMMDYAESRNFVMSANYHGGIELANYPWDAWLSTQNPHPDNDWFRTVSREYADNAQANSPDGYFTGQDNGVTHGGDWYVVDGSRQDYMTYWHNCREITMEVSNTKNPASSELPNFWDYNKEAMLSYIEWLYTGIQGTVTNTQGDPLDATISIEGHDRDNSHVVTNPQNGYYIRMIEPGTYDVTYSSQGYISQSHQITVDSYTSLMIKDVELQSATQTNLTGVVTDAQTGNPISNVKIELVNTEISPVYTNAQGEYQFQSIYEGIYQVKASKEGYLLKVFDHTLTQESNTLDFSLSPADSESFEYNIPDGFTFTGGNWTRDNSQAYYGDYSMKSASIGDSQSTTMQITLNVAYDSEITFARKVSSESGYDYLKFYIDDVEKDSWSGELDWEEVTYQVNEGTKTFKWVYEKDVSASDGSDCAWVDNIIFPQSFQNVTFTVSSEGQPVEGALVDFNQTSQVTNSTGVAEFINTGRGSGKEFVITKQGFETVTDQLDVKYVDINKPVSIVANEELFNVVFIVTDEQENPVENATVTFNLVSKDTDSNGQVEYSNVPQGQYEYSVVADDFSLHESEVEVNADETFTIQLLPVGVNNLTDINTTLKIWPNPFRSQLNIEFSIAEQSHITVDLYSSTGQKIRTLSNSKYSKGNHVISLHDLSSKANLSHGIYIIRFTTDNEVVSKRLFFAPDAP